MNVMHTRNRVFSLLALLLALCLAFPALAEEGGLEGVELEEISIEDLAPQEETLVSNPLPIDFTGGFLPLPEGYKGETVYEDPTIRVEINYRDVSDLIVGYRGRDAGAWIVDIRIGDASQLRTAAAESFKTNRTDSVVNIASRVNAVVAFNGDYSGRQDDGLIFRQGTLFKDKLRGKRDVLLIDEDGDLHPLHTPKKGEFTDVINGKKVINAFCFGPILVENGEIPEKMNNFTFLKPNEHYARIALCQVGPLHYKVILTTMEQSYTLGLQIPAFAKLCQEEGAITAFNLDGGNSTTLYFNGDRVNTQYKVNFRDVPDIFYFASAWNGGTAE